MALCSDMAGLGRWLKLARWLRERDLTCACVAGKHASSNPYQRPAASSPLSQNHHRPTVLLHSAKRKVRSCLSSSLPVSQVVTISTFLHSARVRHVNLCTQQ